MNHYRELKFKRIYIFFLSSFLILTIGYSLGMLYMTEFEGMTGWLTIGFGAALLLMAGALVWVLRSQVKAVIRTVDDIVDGAISGRRRITGYAETNLSSLENKLTRYIDMSRAHEQNKEAEKNKIQGLISDISHQTKTPLSNIHLYTQLLEEQPLPDESSRYLVAQIKTQSEKLNWLIQSLIKMSRLETGVIAIRAGAHPVLPTVMAAVSQVYAEAEARKIRIGVSCDPTTAASHDPKWTGEALFNILDNAVKYSNNGEQILISVKAGEMFTRINIADHGIGIAESELNLVFQRFYRCAKTPVNEGVGIGLYLAREIVTSQGGYIKASSKPGEGSVFSVFLPVN
ncbi:Alkaline phosphatase synthesis sensor protein phoR [Chlamydia abortus]|uniref:histidine kinase n=1 Tax=Paenibacillus residui TaxID=629724 RepID=A0ABW3D6Z0_9BACL|nr:Alkaline phosphatase synthesis sensor protein phoR [Chlamydia abortus]